MKFLVPPERPPEELAAALSRMPDLRVIQTRSAGVDWILPVLPDGVTLCDGRGVHDAPVAEWVVGALLALWKRLPDALRAASQSHWQPEPLADVEGKCVLILGYGSIGAAVEARLAPFGVRLERVARRARPEVATLADLGTLLPAADAVVVLLPLTEETRGVVDARFLAAMKPGALLVNAARGGLMASNALLDALCQGRIRAALDVTDPEPLPPEHPLWRASNLLLTPHVAGDVPRFRERAYRLVRTQLKRFLQGQPLENVVADGY